MPASAVIPALRVYDNIAAVKTFVAHTGGYLVEVEGSRFLWLAVLTVSMGNSS